MDETTRDRRPSKSAGVAGSAATTRRRGPPRASAAGSTCSIAASMSASCSIRGSGVGRRAGRAGCRRAAEGALRCSGRGAGHAQRRLGRPRLPNRENGCRWITPGSQREPVDPVSTTRRDGGNRLLADISSVAGARRSGRLTPPPTANAAKYAGRELPTVLDPGTSSSSTALRCTAHTQTKPHAIATGVRGP